MDQDVKRKALDKTLRQIEKSSGKGAVMKLDDPNNMMNMEAMSTGLLSLGLALGLGGIPKGRVIEVYGPELSGKTMVALHMVAEVQERGGIAGFIDAGYALDLVYAKDIGVNVDNLYISQPDTGEQAPEITRTMVWGGAVDIITVDSVATLVSRAEVEGDMGDLYVGLQACLMSQTPYKLVSIVNNTNSTVVLINQLCEKIGITLGSPEATTDGRALKFYSPVRLDVWKVDVLKQGGEIVGTRVRVEAVKNKIVLPFKEAEFDIMFGKGILKEGDILDLAVKESIVGRGGVWFSYEGNKIGQGRENAKSFLHEHPILAAEIENRVCEAHGLASVEIKALPEGAESALPLTEEWDAE